MNIEVETTLAKNITALEGMEAYDAACKKLLSNREILAWIMQSCLEEYRDMDRKDIEACIEGEPEIGVEAVFPDEVAEGETEPGLENKPKPEQGKQKKLPEQIRGANVEDSSLKEKTITFDIRFYATAPGGEGQIEIIINLEIQNDFYAGYPLIKRALYYCSRMISSQYGREFVHQEYDKIKKVYSIWLCAEPPQYRQNTITRYAVKEENLVGNVTEEKANYDLLTAIIICLGPEEEGQADVLNLLEVLLSSEKKAEEKKKVLSEEYDITMTEILERGIEEMCNLSKGVDQRGFQRGMEQGIQQEREAGTLRSIQSLMKTLHLTAEQAMEALEIEDSKRNRYAEQLKAN